MTLPIVTTPTYTLTQPSTGKQISFRPFLVKEEKILLMSSQSDDPQEAQRDSIRAMKQVITNCCTGLGSIDDLPLFDLEYIFLQLRAKSVGEVAEPEIQCPKCGERIKLKIDLSKVKVKMPKEVNFDIRINEKIGLKMKYPSFQVFETRLTGRDLGIDELFDVLIDCIDSIYDENEVHKVSDAGRESVLAFLESLTQAQFVKIQNFFENMPKLEHRAKYTCKNKVRTGDATSGPCGHKGEILLDTATDFFV